MAIDRADGAGNGAGPSHSGATGRIDVAGSVLCVLGPGSLTGGIIAASGHPLATPMMWGALLHAANSGALILLVVELQTVSGCVPACSVALSGEPVVAAAVE